MILILAVVANSLAIAPGAPATEPPPADYIAMAPSLSQPIPDATIRTDIVELPMKDGETIYLEISRPVDAVGADIEVPVILEASPYHGTLATRIGDRFFPDPRDDEGLSMGLVGYFAPRGYAVAMMDLRGTGRSSGCLDHLGPKDASDLKEVIEWLATQPWSSGRVGMAGHSYPGSTPSVAAAIRPQGLTTIIASAGLASMYDHQFHKGVPWYLQWVGPMASYYTLALEADLPPSGDNFRPGQTDPTETGCGFESASLLAGTGQATGQYELWHAMRDYRDGARESDIPIFLIHGVNDNAARITDAEWFLGGRFDRAADKVWIGQWDHGSTNGNCLDQYGVHALHPTCRFDQFKYAIHTWFDKHLKLMAVETGPPVEVFLNTDRISNSDSTGGKIFTANSWSRSTQYFELWADALQGTLQMERPDTDASVSFVNGGNNALNYSFLNYYLSEKVSFEMPAEDAFKENTVLLGIPRLRLTASFSTAQVVHLIATLYRVDSNGDRTPVNYCAIQPQLRYGVHHVAPIVPGEKMALELQCFAAAHWIPAGNRLALEIGTTSPHHASFGGSDAQITIYTGGDKTGYWRMPSMDNPTLFDDVPLYEPAIQYPPGPAQPGIQGTVFVGVPGVGQRIDGLTQGTFEFDILGPDDGFDNAELVAWANSEIDTYPWDNRVNVAVGDIDLYLQRQLKDGTWSGDMAAAESSSLYDEMLAAGRPLEGHYRLVVHNWSATPGEFRISIVFRNSEGYAG